MDQRIKNICFSLFDLSTQEADKANAIQDNRLLAKYHGGKSGAFFKAVEVICKEYDLPLRSVQLDWLEARRPSEKEKLDALRLRYGFTSCS